MSYILVCLVAFGIGVITTILANKDHIRDLKEEISNIKIDSAEKLSSAYEEIDKLKKDNQILIKQLSKYENNN